MISFNYDYDTEVSRTYVIKYYKNFLSQKQIADQMGVSINTVRKIIDGENLSRSTKIKLRSWAIKKQKEFDNFKGEQLKLM